MKNKKTTERKNKKINKTPSASAFLGQPVTCEALLNKYGTYEIQPTADSENEFPEISQH